MLRYDEALSVKKVFFAMRGHVIIGTFHDPNLAALVRSRLENEGIQVIVPFEHTNALRIPFVSSTLKLYVREEDEVSALAVLDDPAAEADGDSSEVDTLTSEEDGEYACPHCQSASIRLLPAPVIPSLLAMIVPGYSMRDIPSRWHCNSCDQVWEEKT